MDLGKELRKARKAKGLRQIDLSLPLGYKSTQFISLMEKGLSEVPLTVLGKLCYLLKINKGEMIEKLVAKKRRELEVEISSGYREMKEQDLL